LNASLVPEVALVVVAGREGVAETGQEIVKLCGLIARCSLRGMSIPPPMMKSNALLLGELLATMQPHSLCR